ncbi:MAG: hypothetical protein ABIX28_22845, partial [Vicinamibacterales bacterium]
MPPRSALETFTADLLSHAGAIVEPAGEGLLEVVAGPDLSAALGLIEYQQLAFGRGTANEAAAIVDYDSPLVERMGAAVSRLGCVSSIAGPPVTLRPIDPDAALERALALQNGVYRCQGATAVETLYAGFFFEYGVLADERAGGLTLVWVNPAVKSIPRLFSRLDLASCTDDRSPPAPWPGEPGRLPWALASAAARASIEPEIAEFMVRLRRRRERDAQRVRDYYAEIDAEIRRKLRRTRAEDSARREQDRLAATTAAYRGRVVEIVDRYRVRIRLAPVGVLLCRLPAWQIGVRLMRRSAGVDALFSWNPLDGRIETRACDGCLGPVTAAWLCDDAVHYV